MENNKRQATEAERRIVVAHKEDRVPVSDIAKEMRMDIADVLDTITAWWRGELKW